MPSAITRYITKELLGWFSLWLVLLTALVVIILVGQEAVRTNLGLGPMLRLLPFVLPTSLAYAVPGTILFTVCLVYGRMSADNEVVATKALGHLAADAALAGLFAGVRVEPRRRVAERPGLFLGPARHAAGRDSVGRGNRVRHAPHAKVVRQPAVLDRRQGRAGPEADQTVHHVSGQQRHARGDDLGRGGGAANQPVAEHDDVDPRSFRAEGRRHGRTATFPAREAREYPLEFLSARDSRQGNPANLPLSQIADEVAAQEQLIEELEQSLAAETALALVTGELHDLRDAAWKPRRSQLAAARSRLHRLQTEPWRRWAAGFSSLAFVLVGAPLAILLRQSRRDDDVRPRLRADPDRLLPALRRLLRPGQGRGLAALHGLDRQSGPRRGRYLAAPAGGSVLTSAGTGKG